jgi:hypothetical protein
MKRAIYIPIVIIGLIVAYFVKYGVYGNEGVAAALIIVLLITLFMIAITSEDTNHYCLRCGFETDYEELRENSLYGAYGFSPICNKCVDKIDSEMDQQQQDKA